MTQPWYATREHVLNGLDVKVTARNYPQVDRAVEAGARSVEGLTHRTFRPTLTTVYLDWPNWQYAGPWQVWLDADELISLTTLVAGGITIPSTDYFLRNSSGDTQPPYNRIEINLASSSALAAGDTHQRAIAATGLVGFRNDEKQVGDLAGTLAATQGATGSATWTTPHIGVGDVLRIDSERMIVTGKVMVDSLQNLGGALTASMANTTVPVASTAAFTVDTVLRIDSERMLVVDVGDTALTVRRAWDGTVLAAHTTNTDVYTLTGVQLDRGQLGTTIAAHSSGADIFQHLVPGLVRELNIAEAINTIQQEGSGYARRSGLGEERGGGRIGAIMEASGRGLDDIRDRVEATFGRKARIRAI